MISVSRPVSVRIPAAAPLTPRRRTLSVRCSASPKRTASELGLTEEQLERLYTRMNLTREQAFKIMDLAQHMLDTDGDRLRPLLRQNRGLLDALQAAYLAEDRNLPQKMSELTDEAKRVAARGGKGQNGMLASFLRLFD